MCYVCENGDSVRGDVQQNSGEEVEGGVTSGVSSLAQPKSISFTIGPARRMFSGWCVCVRVREGEESVECEGERVR